MRHAVKGVYYINHKLTLYLEFRNHAQLVLYLYFERGCVMFFGLSIE